jgi:hypothetical protein
MSGSNAPTFDTGQSGFSTGGYQMATPFYVPQEYNIEQESGGVFAPDNYTIFSPAFSSGEGAFGGVDPNLVQAAFDNFQQAGNDALGTVANFGGFVFQGTQGTLSGWETDQNTLSTSFANTFAEAVSKSATACSGFFSCLF